MEDLHLNHCLKFSDIFETIAPIEQDQVVNHPLYQEIAAGTLPLEKYQVLIQQDDWYLRSYYDAFGLLWAKETDPERKSQLQKDPTVFKKWFEQQYVKYSFEPIPENCIAAYTEDYIKFFLEVAESDTATVLEGLVSLYPCKRLWNKMGKEMSKIANLDKNLNHKYKDFIESQTSGTFEKTKIFIDKYFEDICRSENSDLKARIYEIAKQGILHELKFADGVYGRPSV